MKTMQYLFTILCFAAISVFGQSEINWKTQKNSAFNQTGIGAEGHHSVFSTQLFKNDKRFIELGGGAGVFSPLDDNRQTASSGLTFNKGKNKHFFSVGMHFTYAADNSFQIASILKQEAYMSNARIGYHYQTGKINFKFHIQPINGISQRINNLGSSASLSIQL